MHSILAPKNVNLDIVNHAVQGDEVKPLSIEELEMIGGGECVVNDY